MHTLTDNPEILRLIKEWEENPSWELEDSPGFEDYYNLLRLYRLEKEEQWAKEERKRKENIAKAMGLSIDEYDKWKHFKDLSEHHRCLARKLMLNLVFGTDKCPPEQIASVDGILDSLFRGTINSAKAEIIAERYKIK